MRCEGCGSPLDDDARFCSRCGTPQPVYESEPTDTLPTISVAEIVGTPLLIVTRGANAGSRFALDQPTTRIGRHPRSDIFLDDVTVSRDHAVVESGPDGFTITDKKSLNGTYVNNELVSSARIGEGDRIQIGKYMLLFAVEVG